MRDKKTHAPLAPRHAGAWLAVSTAAAALVVWDRGVSPWHLVLAGAAGVLVWLSALDLQHRLLPNRIVLPAGAVVLVSATAWADAPLSHWVAAVVAALALGLAVMLRPGSLGMGDAKLALLLGALLGGAVFDALAIGFCLVGAAAVVLLLRDGRAGLSRHLPLGPFLAAGALAVLLF